jgi:type I restriction enzyme R subunit
MAIVTVNFSFLEEHDPLFVQLATTAENVFASDPNTTLIKLRQLGEAMAQFIAVKMGVSFDEQTSQHDLIYRIDREMRLDPTVKNLFHALRIEGNKATHEFTTRHQEAMQGLRLARNLAIWFHRSFSDKTDNFKPGAFQPPQDHNQKLLENFRALQAQIEQLKAQLQDANQELESNQELHDLLEREKSEYAELAEWMDQESRQYKEQVEEAEKALQQQEKQYATQIKQLQEKLDEQTQAALQEQRSKVKSRNKSASQSIELTEEETRVLIDQQLIEAGWEADTKRLDYRQGARPEKGVNRAIAEWETSLNGKKGRADYVLFCGLTPVAVVEAKKNNQNVAGKIDQAERYSLGFRVTESLDSPWEVEGRTIAWPDAQDGHYHVPFVYSCNGRPYIKQLAEQSGIWFRDVRDNSNLKRDLQNFHSPDGLLDFLKRDKAKAEEQLRQEDFAYLKLRDYQEKAVQAVEDSLKNGQRECLLAMATGTGKTRTIIGLIYRFLKAERFKRILFLVDRTSLGDQATDAFKDVVLEQNQTLWKSYNIAELGDMAGEAHRVQVATVQALVKRVLMTDEPPPVDFFDCIIVDEAHRGYTLDQEMTEGELATRDATQYLSSYRRVLDYFDAVKIGLTATPAKHTSDIFGKPVYTYSYPEAVADDWLIDHEEPIRYETVLTQNGIHFDKGETVDFIDAKSGNVETAELEDELNFEVDTFNRKVVVESFNKVICKALADEIDPTGDEKTLIFCAPAHNNLHADMVKRLLDEAFKDIYGDEYNQAAVVKITGQTDKVAEKIRAFKNERYPSVVITVDLLTTGIDVKSICNLVFLRRVKSRILFEQMIGRATRRCDEIGKTVFKIYDPVDIYAALSDVNTMKPLVKNPNITLAQLTQELTHPETLQQAMNAPGEREGQTQADVVLDQISQKVMRVLRKAASEADKKPALKTKLDELQENWDIQPDQVHQHLHKLGAEKASEFLLQHQRFIEQIESVKNLLGSENNPIISSHDDELLVREQSYGNYGKPEDYLESFNRFIHEQMNLSAAMSVVVNRPKDLTRAQLKEIRLLLENSGFSEANIKSAWRNTTNQEIAASIIGYIRQAALGEALIPFEQRVHNAMQIIYAQHTWKPVQRKWLERLGKQLVYEVIVDREFVNKRFADKGGAEQLNKILNDQLDDVLQGINLHLWDAA